MARYYDWPGIIAELSKRPSRWELWFPAAPALLARNIRQRRSPDLRRDDGALEARVTNRHTDSDGRERGDVWVRWCPQRDTPKEDTHDDTIAAQAAAAAGSPRQPERSR